MQSGAAWRVPPKRDFSWAKVQPFLVVALIVFLATAVTIILLQSAGAIHLPYLGRGRVPGDRSGATQNWVTEATRRRRSWYSGVWVAGSSAIITPIEPATFNLPCMKATLGSSSPRCMATASCHTVVKVTSGPSTAPGDARDHAAVLQHQW